MVAFWRYVLQGIILLTLVELVFTKSHGGNRGRKKKTRDKWDVNYCPTGRDVKRLEIQMKCPKKHVLSDIEVLAGRSMPNCGETGTNVYGRTPDLITAVNQCYWMRSCIINFTHMKMVTCVSLNALQSEPDVYFNYNCNCFLADVEFLRPVRAKCVKETEVTTICGKKSNPKKQGLIKSHEILPWYYDRSLRNRTCTMAFDVNKKMAIGVKYAELYDEDTLTMYIKRNKRLINRVDLGNRTCIGEMIEITPDNMDKKSINFTFQVSDDTRGSGGFIICYKEIKENDKITNVCDSLSTKKKRSGKIVERRPKLKVLYKQESCDMK